jgi:hypothetical protein
MEFRRNSYPDHYILDDVHPMEEIVPIFTRVQDNLGFSTRCGVFSVCHRGGCFG